MSYSNDFRPFFILIKKEEEKGDKFAKITMEVKHKPIAEPINPFTKKAAFTQTYPTKLVPASPRKACCYYCSQFVQLKNMQSTDAKKKKIPFIHLISIFWAKCFGDTLSVTVQIFCTRRLYKHLPFQLASVPIFAQLSECGVS